MEHKYVRPSRNLCRPNKIRIIVNEEQFNSAWPPFIESLGQYPAVGLKCKWNSSKVVSEMDRMGIGYNGRLKGLGPEESEEWDIDDDDYQYDIQGDYSSQMDRDGRLRKTRDRAAERGGVNLIQLASFGGDVLLIRTVFMESIPPPLVRLLTSTKLKIGQGLERDKRLLQCTFNIALCNFIDVRNICLHWPYLASRLQCERFGIRSIARRLLRTDYSEIAVAPFWVLNQLDKDQVVACAEEVQLSVDIFTLVILRTLGWSLPYNWLHNASFGQAVYLWASPAMERPFYDSFARIKPPFKSVAWVAGKFKLIRRLARKFRYGKTVSLATLWAWPMPNDPEILDQVLIREHGFVLPCSQYPMVTVDTHYISPLSERTTIEVNSDAKSKQSIWKSSTTVYMIGEVRKKDSSLKRKRVRVDLETLSSEGLDGAEGGGNPRDLYNCFPLCDRDDSQREAENQKLIDESLEKLGPSAARTVKSVRQKMEWNRVDMGLERFHTENDSREKIDLAGYLSDNNQAKRVFAAVTGQDPHWRMNGVPVSWKDGEFDGIQSSCNESASSDDLKLPVNEYGLRADVKALAESCLPIASRKNSQYQYSTNDAYSRNHRMMHYESVWAYPSEYRGNEYGCRGRRPSRALLRNSPARNRRITGSRNFQVTKETMESPSEQISMMRKSTPEPLPRSQDFVGKVTPPIVSYSGNFVPICLENGNSDERTWLPSQFTENQLQSIDCDCPRNGIQVEESKSHDFHLPSPSLNPSTYRSGGKSKRGSVRARILRGSNSGQRERIGENAAKIPLINVESASSPSPLNSPRILSSVSRETYFSGSPRTESIVSNGYRHPHLLPDCSPSSKASDSISSSAHRISVPRRRGRGQNPLRGANPIT